MKLLNITLLAALLLASSCTSKTNSQTNTNEDQRKQALTEAESSDFMDDDENAGAAEHWQPIATKNGIELGYFMNSEEFENAELHEKHKPKIEGNKAHFSYNVKNYELMKPTPGAGACMCNNSPQGQHIHQIINDRPYEARYTDTFTSKLEPGRYVQLCFLSRSYHEGIKNKKAYHLSQFTVGDAGKTKEYDLKKPMLFYSRPKGEYKGEDIKNILLDFYLVNTELEENGNKVLADIDGTQFMLSKWAPYAIRGLKPGEHTIKLTLIDKNGKPVDAPFNPISRTIKLVQ